MLDYPFSHMVCPKFINKKPIINGRVHPHALRLSSASICSSLLLQLMRLQDI